MSILITGGAGYIGSITTDLLIRQSEDVIVLDNLSRGHRKAVHPKSTFYKGEINDTALIARIAEKHQIDACIHFAALAYVGESVLEPQKYYQNNTADALALLRALMANNVRRFIFSSTCATYGEPQYMPLDEKHPQWPTSPYGWSKLMVERMLADFDVADQIRFVALRYFNACGAAGELGENHDPETHLIPLVLEVAQGLRPNITIFGDDYDTPDGTAVRDYIHVADLAKAHSLALRHLRNNGNSDFVNLGTGHGHSVLDVVNAARRVTGRDIPIQKAPRRAGDVSYLIANAQKAKVLLGWEPGFLDLDRIIETVWTNIKTSETQA
ncbi:MAG: UDP-glucose 4-epimerase GalE [Abditibacteriaceae bacterium]